MVIICYFLHHGNSGSFFPKHVFNKFYSLSLIDCDIRCGCGYTFTTKRLGYYGHDSTVDVKSIYLCAKNCDDRDGCTGFRYDHEGIENYNCKTYTGGKRTIGISEEASGWTNCLKGKLEVYI